MTVSDSDSPVGHRRVKAIPVNKRVVGDDIFKRPVYKTGDGDYKYTERPGSMTAYKLPSRGLL